MLGLDITKLIAAWGNAPLKINPTQCLPLRSLKSNCKSCVENCPVAAIEINQGSIKVVDEQCTGCGICSSLCPTGVFEMTNFEVGAFVEKARRKPPEDKAVKIECYKIPFEYSLPQSLRLPCLAHITPGLILKLIAAGSDEIVVRDAGICKVCESRCGDRIANDVVSGTQGLLKVLGLEQKVSIVMEGISINGLAHKGERLKDYNYKDDPNMSRRDIFSLFKREAKKGVAGMMKDEPKNEGRERFKKVLPKQRAELLRALKTLSPNLQADTEHLASGNDRAFFTVTVKKSCNMCRLCGLFCPTDALTIENTENGEGIVFKAATCTGCNLCVDVCPEDAITLNNKEFLIDSIIKQNKTALIWFNKANCTSCGRSFVDAWTPPQELCDTCRKERDIF